MRPPILAALASFALLFSASPADAAEAEEGEGESLTRPPSHYLAVTPSWSHAFVPRSVSHDGVGLTVESFLGHRMSVLLTGALYAPFSRTLSPAAPDADRRTETLGNVVPEVHVTLLRSERVELAVGGGPGAIVTRPVSLVDPEHRRFDWEARLAFSHGIYARTFVTRAVAISFDLRDVVYIEQLESAAPGADEASRRDPSTWYGDKPLTHRIEGRLGITVFLGPR